VGSNYWFSPTPTTAARLAGYPTLNLQYAYRNDPNLPQYLHPTTGCEPFDFNLIDHNNNTLATNATTSTGRQMPTANWYYLWKLGLISSKAYSQYMLRYKEGLAASPNAITIGNNANDFATYYSHYATDGHPKFRQNLWEETRNINSNIRGIKYSTPDFYPHISAWADAPGAFHGLEWVAECRRIELKHEPEANVVPARQNPLYPPNAAINNIVHPWITYANRPADILFSPYVSPGWDAQEFLNMRPGQYLGLLKVLGVMGAEFFYSGYFHNHDMYKSIGDQGCGVATAYTLLTAPTSPSQNVNDMIWQAAMPSYAQAAMSQAPEFFFDGATGSPAAATLLAKDNLSTTTLPYTKCNGTAGSIYCQSNYYKLQASIIPATPTNTNATDAEIVAVARQLGSSSKFLITLTLQPKNGAYGTYILGSTPTNTFYNPSIPPNAYASVSVQLPTVSGSSVNFSLFATRQGRTYVIDKTTATTKIICVDAWHEWKHPAHWTRSIILESELPSNIIGTSFVNTIRPAGLINNSENFTKFTSFVNNNQTYEYDFEPTQNGNYAIYVRAASDNNAAATINAQILMKNKLGATVQTIQLNSVNLPPCTAVGHYEWRKFPVALPVSLSNAYKYTLVINPGTGSNAQSDIDQFFITINDPVPAIDEITGFNNDCNP
jgi:hypothetical protein